MIKPISARITAIFALLAGTGWLTMTLIAPIATAIKEGPTLTLGSLFMSLLIAMISIPGFYAIYGGYSLLRKKSPHTIKIAVGTSATLIGMVVAALLPDQLQEFAYALTILVIALPLYIFWAKATMTREGLAQSRPGEFIGQGTFSLISFVIYLTLNGGIDKFYPRSSRRDEIELLGEAALVFGPILIAILFYKISTFILAKRTKNLPLIP